MCGIYEGVSSEGVVAPLIHGALVRLEYRGYDSVGVATVFDGGLCVKKHSGLVVVMHNGIIDHFGELE